MRNLAILMIAVINLMIASCGKTNGYKSPEQIQEEKSSAVENVVEENLNAVSSTESDLSESDVEDEDSDIYQALVSNDLPGVIDFTATWCGPCQKMKPIFHKLAKKFKGKYNFISIDIDKYPEIAEKYHIQSIPTFVFIDADGNEGNRITGLVEESVLAEELDNPAWF